MPDQVVKNSGRNPFQVLVLLWSVIIGLASAFGFLWPEDVDYHIPTWFNIAWGVSFALGSATALVGVRLKNRVIGVLLEQIGLIILSAACWTMAATILIIGGVSSFPSVLLFSILGTACLAQWIRLEIFIKSIIHGGHDTSEGKGD